MNKMIESLLDKNLYSIKNKDIILKQTHISFVIMTDDYVYKIKKPVNFKFLDFSTLEKRKYYCEKEVELNKRLSPDVYLGVLEIKKNKGIYSFNNEGETVDYCVKMIRIPEEKMMIHLIKKNQVHESDINNIADLIASFHKKAETNSNISKYGSIDAVKKNINGNYEYAINYINQTLSAETYRAIKDFTDNFFIKNKSLFEKRMKTGKIKDCHGDIHMEHICLSDKTYIYDCIEFNDRFRYCDVASEIAFLAMDLDFHNRSDLSNFFIEKYIEITKDNEIQDILNFYKCYRACVRGKVNSLELDDSQLNKTEREEAQNRAQKYFNLALSYTR